jgi:hypothetical protein
MRSHPLATRVAAILGATILLTSLLAGTTLARKPSFIPSAEAFPQTVTYGQLVRFDIGWTNTSGANLPTVNMKATTAAVEAGAEFVQLVALPTVDFARQGDCQTQTATLLACAFGAVRNGSTVRFSAVYNVPDSGSFSQDFVFTAQGDTTSDTGGNSRGDDMPVRASVTLVAGGSSLEAGSYILDSVGVENDVDTVETNPSLTKRGNPQSTLLDFSDSADNFGAYVREQNSTACTSDITTCYGQLVVMQVNKGLDVDGHFVVTAGYESVPGSAQGGFLHWSTDDATGTPERIDQTCAETSGESPCILDVFKTNGHTFYVIQLDSNGAMRGF